MLKWMIKNISISITSIFVLMEHNDQRCRGRHIERLRPHDDQQHVQVCHHGQRFLHIEHTLVQSPEWAHRNDRPIDTFFTLTNSFLLKNCHQRCLFWSGTRTCTTCRTLSFRLWTCLCRMRSGSLQDRTLFLRCASKIVSRFSGTIQTSTYSSSTNFLIDAELIIDASTSNMMCSFDFDRAPAMQHQSMFVGDCAVWSWTAHNYYAKTPVWMRNDRTFFIQF